MGALKLKGVLLSAAMSVAVFSTMPAQANGLKCEPGETYIMNVMVSGHPYWVPVYQGFKQAAEAFGCETVFSGTPDYDITKQIASFEQDMVKQPAGILVHPMQSDPFIEPINRAIESGTQIVTFAALEMPSPPTDAGPGPMPAECRARDAPRLHRRCSPADAVPVT